MQCEMLQWKHATENKISSIDCESKDKIEELAKACYKEVEEKITKIHLELVDDMTKFLNSSEHSETLSTWKQDTEHRLRHLEVESKMEAELCYKELLKTKLNHTEIEVMEKNQIREVRHYIRALVTKSQNEGKQLSDKDIEEKFEVEWRKWMGRCFAKKAEKVNYPSDYDIESSVLLLKY